MQNGQGWATVGTLPDYRFHQDEICKQSWVLVLSDEEGGAAQGHPYSNPPRVARHVLIRVPRDMSGHGIDPSGSVTQVVRGSVSVPREVWNDAVDAPRPLSSKYVAELLHNGQPHLLAEAVRVAEEDGRARLRGEGGAEKAPQEPVRLQPRRAAHNL